MIIVFYHILQWVDDSICINSIMCIGSISSYQVHYHTWEILEGEDFGEFDQRQHNSPKIFL